MLKKKSPACLVWFVIILFLQGLWMSCCSTSVHAQGKRAPSQLVVKKGERTAIFSNEYGEISAAWITDGTTANYLLHTFTLLPKSMFLPVILNSDMILHVKSGRGRLGWTDEGKSRYTDLEEGDVLRVLQGVVFFIYCHPKTVQPLQINAIFTNSDHDLREPEAGPYASIQELVLGFDRKALQPTFKVSVDLIDQVLGGTKPPPIAHVDDPSTFQADNILQDSIKKANILKKEKDFENSYGWVATQALQGADIGFFMMNLTAGSMMEPNWNSVAEEVVVVLEGRGMVRVVCSEFSQMRGCSNKRFEVREGDVLVVPRLHGKALMAFDDGPLILMGFVRVSREREEPQYLGGRNSVLGNLGNDVVAKTFNVSITTVAKLLAHEDESIIFACTSCADEEFLAQNSHD